MPFSLYSLNLWWARWTQRSAISRLVLAVFVFFFSQTKLLEVGLYLPGKTIFPSALSCAAVKLGDFLASRHPNQATRALRREEIGKRFNSFGTLSRFPSVPPVLSSMAILYNPSRGSGLTRLERTHSAAPAKRQAFPRNIYATFFSCCSALPHSADNHSCDSTKALFY